MVLKSRDYVIKISTFKKLYPVNCTLVCSHEKVKSLCFSGGISDNNCINAIGVSDRFCCIECLSAV